MNKLPIEISDLAFLEIKSIMETKNIPSDYFLRVGVKGSGCSGTSFFIGFDKINTNDQTFTFGNVNIVIEKKHFLYLSGMKVDFVNNSNERGFIFVNIVENKIDV